MKITDKKPHQPTIDAARMLGIASRLVKRAADPVLTPEYRAKLIAQARANIDAATARL